MGVMVEKAGMKMVDFRASAKVGGAMKELTADGE